MFRKLKDDEKRLIKKLLVDVEHINNLDDIIVKPMSDGGMGSLLLFSSKKNNENRFFGKQLSEFQFTDIDGINVIASLNVDTDGELFELDIWKTDFSKLKKIPKWNNENNR